MARGINKVILVGTLGKDPEVRYSQAGAALTSISVATNESWKDKNGEKQERTEWHRVKFFGRLAEIAGEYLTKGSQVYIEGSLRTEKYTDKQGVEKYSTDVIAQELQMLGGGAGGGEGRDSGGSSRGGGGSRGGAPEGRTGGSGGGRSSGERGGVERDAPAERSAPAASRADEPFPDDDIPF